MTKTNVKVVKRVKKVNEKEVAKDEIMKVIKDALAENGIQIKDGVKYGMTKGTIIVETEKTDIQIKPIAPKHGITRYPILVFED